MMTEPTVTTPRRIQRSRAKGSRLPENTISVTRPGRWGNMFVVWKDDHRQWTVSLGGCHWRPTENTRAAAQKMAVEKFRANVAPDGPQHYRGFNPPPTQVDIIKALRGKNLACFCAIGEPCHADVLLDLANQPLCEVV